MPSTTSTEPTPELSTCAMMLAGAAALGWTYRRRRAVAHA
ncbi:MAG TPA: MYXO-CTERM sorting domain-containing protein [Roseiarcus sp.]|nr:MYXO-CTERM sorting domain-containing protein [Roseiarcus sp.]